MAELRRDRAAEGLPSRAAARLERPSWKDGRLIAGVLLLILATALGALTLRHFDNSVEVLAAKHTLVPGDTVTAADVQIVKVRLDRNPSTYVRAARSLPSKVALREIRAGELVPASALGATSQITTKTVAVPVDPAQASGLVRGSVVDVWVSRRTAGATGSNDFDDPTREVARATIDRVPSAGGGLSVSSGAAYVQVMVPEARVSALIAAVSRGAKVTLVPAAGSLTKGNS